MLTESDHKRLNAAWAVLDKEIRSQNPFAVVYESMCRRGSLLLSHCQDDALKDLKEIHVACSAQNVERMRATNRHRTDNAA